MHKSIWTPNLVVKIVPGQFLVQGRAIMDAEKKYVLKPVSNRHELFVLITHDFTNRQISNVEM
jgi:hypothetical protein